MSGDDPKPACGHGIVALLLCLALWAVILIAAKRLDKLESRVKALESMPAEKQ